MENLLWKFICNFKSITEEATHENILLFYLSFSKMNSIESTESIELVENYF